MTSPRFVLPWFILVCAILLPGCTKERVALSLPIGGPVLAAIGAPASAKIQHLEISARPPAVTAWNVRLSKDPNGIWKVLSRSDRSSPDMTPDLADGKLIQHLLEILSTFATESEVGKGTESSFGLNPYRFEIRFGETEANQILRLGDGSGINGVYFRIGEENGTPWTGRGALIAFLPTIETPEAFILKRPYAISEEIESIALEKLEGSDRGFWSFVRSGSQWREGNHDLPLERSALIERIFRQRILRVLPASEMREIPPLNRHPDWRITYRSHSGAETLAVTFQLDQVLGMNPARSPQSLELYPEFAGALRAFTQARFIPLKSGTK